MKKHSNDILFFCSFPPPNTGQTIATKLIYDCVNEFVGTTDAINIVDKKRLQRNSGDFNLLFVFTLIGKIIKLFTKTLGNNYKQVYVVFAPAKFALVRDVVCTFIIKTFSKAKLIAHLHSGNYGDNFKGGIFKKLFSWLLARVDVLIVLSPRVNNIADKVTPNKIVYLTNMISPDITCSDAEITQKLADKNNRDEFNIVYISNMIAEKGYNDLVKAVQILKSSYSATKFKMHLIGGWPSENIRVEFEKSLLGNGLSDSVTVYGPVYDRARIKGFFLLADVFVLPTYYAIEAQPLSIIEALNAATPVISTNHASIPDMVEDGVTGFLVPAKDAPAIANALYKLTNTGQWMQMAEAARVTYKRNYDKEVIIPRLVNIFSSN